VGHVVDVPILAADNHILYQSKQGNQSLPGVASHFTCCEFRMGAFKKRKFWTELGMRRKEKIMEGGTKLNNNSNRENSRKSFARKLVHMILAISVAFVVCVSIVAGVLLANSTGKPKPFLDSNGKPLSGSISEKIHVKINGVEQGMFIKGKDKMKPVLLFLHGGPGLPEYAIRYQYPALLEEDFVVCWREQ